MKFLDETEADDPILSVVNLIDVFLVIIAALLITVAKNPLLSPFSKQDVTVITDAGKPTMEVIQKRGEKIEKYKASGEIGEGDGEKAGVAYRMKDGSMVYVPEGGLMDQATAPAPGGMGGADAAFVLACACRFAGLPLERLGRCRQPAAAAYRLGGHGRTV